MNLSSDKHHLMPRWFHAIMQYTGGYPRIIFLSETLNLSLFFFFFFFEKHTHTHTYMGEENEIREYTHTPTPKLHATVSVAEQVINPFLIITSY